MLSGAKEARKMAAFHIARAASASGSSSWETSDGGSGELLRLFVNHFSIKRIADGVKGIINHRKQPSTCHGCGTILDRNRIDRRVDDR